MKLFVCLVSFLLQFGISLAFGIQQHIYLGKVLELHLQENHKELYSKVKNIYPDFVFSSSWADKIKSKPEYAWTKKLHYIDILECTVNNTIDNTIDIMKYCRDGCIVSAINEYVYSNRRHELDLLFHLLQDINQPLHVYGIYRGGNNYKIKIGNRTISMHYLWDTLLLNKYISGNGYYKTTSIAISNYEEVLQNIIMINLGIGCKAYTGHEINFNDYYNSQTIELLIYNYLSLAVNVLDFMVKNNGDDYVSRKLDDFKSRKLINYINLI